MKPNKNLLLLALVPLIAGGALAQDLLLGGEEGGKVRQPTAIQPAKRAQTPKIEVEAKTRTITLEAAVWQNKVGIEVFACGPQGREHETVMIVFNTPAELYSALRQAGGLLPANMPTDDEAIVDLRGRRLLMTITWKDAQGQPITRLAEELMLDDLTLQPAWPVGWSFLARDTGEKYTDKFDGIFEANLTYVGLRGEAEGVLEYAPARQPYTPTMYDCDTPLLPTDIPRPEGVPAKLTIQVVSETEALNQIIVSLEKRVEAGQPAPATLVLARSLLPITQELDRYKAALFGPAGEQAAGAARQVAELAEKNAAPDSSAAQSALARLKQASAVSSLLRYLVARDYVRIDLAYAQLALAQMNPETEARARRVACQTAMIQRIKDRMDGYQLRVNAAIWQYRAGALRLAQLAAASQPAASQPVIHLPDTLAELKSFLTDPALPASLGVPAALAVAQRPVWADLQSQMLINQAELVPAEQNADEEEERMAKENVYFSQFKPTDGLYEATKEMHERAVSQYEEVKAQLAVLECRIRTLAYQQKVMEAASDEDRQWCQARWQEEVQKLDELTKRLALAKLVNERYAASFEMEKLQVFDSPENKAQLETLKDRTERIDVRAAALRKELNLPAVPTPTPAPVFRPQSQPRDE